MAKKRYQGGKGRGKHNMNDVSARNYQDKMMDEEFIRGKDSVKFPQGKARCKVENDPSWYAKNEQLLKDSASFSYNTPLGSPINLLDVYGVALNDTSATGVKSVSKNAASIPGVMSIVTMPSFGISTDSTSPVNLAAQNIYSYVRYKNSGAANYDAPDLMLYILAMDSLYSAWNWLKRIYGVVNSYSQYNRYLPKALVAANAIDFDSVNSNIAQLRAFLNRTAAQISSFAVPATLTYNVRHSWMYSNVYTDGESNKAQCYMFVPKCFYLYDETTSPNGGKLTPIEVFHAGNPINISTAMGYIDQMLAALSYSEDIGIMSGDIIKAYGNNLFTLSAVTDDYSVRPVHSKEVLSQIENINNVNVGQDMSVFDIGQNPNTNYLTYDPSFVGDGTRLKDAVIINMHHQEVSPADTIVATRLTTIVAKEGTKYVPRSLGSEFVVGIWAWVFSSAADITQVSQYANLTLQQVEMHTYLTIDPALTTSNNHDVVQQLAIWSEFDWHPMVTITYQNSNTGNINYFQPLWDIDNYTIMHTSDLERMNSTALLSLFDVPADGPTF